MCKITSNEHWGFERFKASSYPDSEGRDSSQKRWPWESTAVPPSRLEEPETTSAVMGDFHEPYGAVIFWSSDKGT